MLKYVDTKVVFSEIPDEITLAINISNCPCHCKGCHSAYLAEDGGTWLIYKDDNGVCINIQPLIKSYHGGITCVCFMGGDSEPENINNLGAFLRKDNPSIKVAWYSGRQELSDKIELKNFDYIKIGPYIKELGGLDSKETNQKMYHVVECAYEDGTHGYELEDITYKFHKNAI